MARGSSLPPAHPASYARTLETGRALLDATAWEEAWADGQARPLEQVLADVVEPR